MKARSGRATGTLTIRLSVLAVGAVLAGGPATPASAASPRERVPQRLIQLYPLYQRPASAPPSKAAARLRRSSEAAAGYSPIWVLLSIAGACLVVAVLMACRLSVVPGAGLRRRHGESERPVVRKLGDPVRDSGLLWGSSRMFPRPRHEVGPVVLIALRPLFRYSDWRDAWILRGVGERYGPVLCRAGGKAADRDRGSLRRDGRGGASNSQHG